MNDIQKKNLRNAIGLAQRARKAVSGELSVEKSVQAKKVKLLLIAEDLSESSKKNYLDLATHHRVEIIQCLSKEELGQCIGKEYRAAVAILDSGLAELILKYFR